MNTMNQLSSSARSAHLGASLHSQVVDTVGQKIVAGDLAPDTVINAQQLCSQLGVSRSVVREALRTLASLGLVQARQQVGTRVLGHNSWDLLHPLVVRWRALGPDPVRQLHELLQLRLGLDHVAAALAAQHADDHERTALTDAAATMRRAFQSDDPVAFYTADATFHRMLLTATANPLIQQLAGTIAAALSLRGSDQRRGMHEITDQAVTLHEHLAAAIAVGAADDAAQAAQRLIELSQKEITAATTASEKT
ncbi:FadR/GntR family transcriptional regulator [Microbacterium sp. YY-01]|uniref:FadR/GntR family transcriptional regulator n=1 Tax=Microbacterium sp. YY-01 TaxID=3421634 RepID=UPI003D170094